MSYSIYEYRDIYFSKDKAPVVVAVAAETELPPYHQIFFLNVQPEEGAPFIFIWPGGKISLTWTASIDGPNKILISADLSESLVNLKGALLAQYHLVKEYLVTDWSEPGQQCLRITAKYLGVKYYGITIEASYLTIVNFLTIESFTKYNHQLGLILWEYKQDSALPIWPYTDLVSEHFAPVVKKTYMDYDPEITFDLKDPLHSLTHFTPPPYSITTAAIAQGHFVKFSISLFETWGNPPVLQPLSYQDVKYVLRGGSREENQVDWGDFVNDFILAERQGLLSLSYVNEVTGVENKFKYWLNTQGDVNCSLKIIFFFKNGGSATGYAYTFAANAQKVWILKTDIRLGGRIANLLMAEMDLPIDYVLKYYAFVVDQFTDETYCSLGEFNITESVFGEKYFLFENSYGGAEVLRFTGEKSYSIEVSKAEYQAFSIGSSFWERKTKSQQLIEYIELFECSTGNLTREALMVYVDILLSENVFEIIYQDDQGNNYGGGYRFAINIEPGTFLLTKDNSSGEYLYGFFFKYRKAISEKSLGLINNYY